MAIFHLWKRGVTVFSVMQLGFGSKITGLLGYKLGHASQPNKNTGSLPKSCHEDVSHAWCSEECRGAIASNIAVVRGVAASNIDAMRSAATRYVESTKGVVAVKNIAAK